MADLAEAGGMTIITRRETQLVATLITIATITTKTHQHWRNDDTDGNADGFIDNDNRKRRRR